MFGRPNLTEFFDRTSSTKSSRYAPRSCGCPDADMHTHLHCRTLAHAEYIQQPHYAHDSQSLEHRVHATKQLAMSILEDLRGLVDAHSSTERTCATTPPCLHPKLLEVETVWDVANCACYTLVRVLKGAYCAAQRYALKEPRSDRRVRGPRVRVDRAMGVGGSNGDNDHDDDDCDGGRLALVTGGTRASRWLRKRGCQAPSIARGSTRAVIPARALGETRRRR